MRRALILAYCVSALAAADRDPDAVLNRVAIKVRVRSASLPNYTCVETVTRDYYSPTAGVPKQSCPAVMEEQRQPKNEWNRRLTVTDRLRLDVTLTEHGEIYSWAGASKFEDSEIGQLVRRGPIGTGSFGAALAVVFGLSADKFHYEGSSGNLMEYSYQVGQENSRYKVKAGDSWFYTAFSGRILVDPETAEVIRLTLETGELPSATGSCQVTSAMEFGKVRIGGGEFLLPKQGRQHFVDASSAEVENTTTFASCREYRGDSTVTFFPAPESSTGAVKDVAAPPAGVSAGAPFTFELTAPISADTAAAGDAFTGRLVSALRDGKGKIVAPAHAVVEGRLLRVEIHRTAPRGATLVLKLRTVEIRGVPIPLAADRDWGRAERAKKTPISMPYTWEGNSGVFRLSGDHAVMKAGVRSDWVTR